MTETRIFDEKSFESDLQWLLGSDSKLEHHPYLLEITRAICVIITLTGFTQILKRI